MMKLHLGAFLTALCISMVWTSSATAQDNPYIVREKLPVVATNANGEKCLNVEQWQQVIRVSNQNKGNYEWRLQIEPTIESRPNRAEIG